jgi:hypothetical protein
MLYATVLLILIAFTQADYVPLKLMAGSQWRDSISCDNSAWYFANPDPTVYNLQRSGNQDMTNGVCYRGSWSNLPADRNNLYAEAQWEAFEADGVTPLNDFQLRISGRFYGFCDYEPSDALGLDIKYQWQNNGGDASAGSNDNWAASQNVFEVDKNRNNCDGWSGELTSTNTAWLDQVACTTGDNGVSCYMDYTHDVIVSGGNRFALNWYANLNNGFNNEAWAFGDLTLQIVDIHEGDCCVGTRNDNPQKSCSAFGERRNCLNKGCEWSEAVHCQIDCCRKVVSASKKKPKCKEFSTDLTKCGGSGRKDCEIRKCNCNGYWDGLNKPEGNPCPSKN